MQYNLLNGLAILGGALLGIGLRRFLSRQITDALILAMGFGVVYVGIRTLDFEAVTLYVLLSLAIGVILGTILGIQKRIHRLGDRLKARFDRHADDSTFVLGFVTTTILFCAGSMGILGSLEAGLTGDGETLIAKALIDGITAMIYGATLGVGVAFSSVPTVLYQAIFVIAARAISSIATPVLIATLSSVGGIIIIAIGANMISGKNFPLADFIPAVFVPFVFGLFGLL